MPTLTKARALHPSVYDAHVAAQRAYRVVHGAKALCPTATLVQDDGRTMNVVKLKQPATPPMAQEKRLRGEEGQEAVPEYVRTAVSHQSHAQRRLEHKRLRHVRRPQQHFVASPMDNLRSPQTSIGNTRPVVYMSASVGTAVEAISPKRIHQRNVQSKTVSRPAWPVGGKDVPRYQSKDPFYRISSLEKAGPAKDTSSHATEGAIEAPSPKRVKDRRRLAGDRAFTSTLPIQPGKKLTWLHITLTH